MSTSFLELKKNREELEEYAMIWKGPVMIIESTT